jgi:F-type H+-transporting ATPase subunit a
MHHVQDDTVWEFFHGQTVGLGEIDLFGLYKFQLTKFMLLELLAAGLLLAIFIPLARRARSGALPTGRFWNAFESLLTFIRDEVARPTLTGHGRPEDADRFLPFLWTMFLFILFCNLLGLLPFLASPTASIWVTGALAVCSLVMMHGAAIAKVGVVHYFKSLWPHIEIVPSPWGTPGHGHGHGGHGVEARVPPEGHEPPAAAPPTTGQVLTWVVGWSFGLLLSSMIFTIEFLGSFIKSVVLAVRLFANMFAGHMVLATILTFIWVVGQAGLSALWVGVTAASVLGVVALSLLELFVAFLQAYIFTFLTALFMGMNLNPEH